ncbi:RNA polymerase sigma factor [Haloferula chungangensis]|uniref:RNA polymerase sigma factor n=1 Tax=Haloferula chungangensis TaxID=1048331 RepID=A0ABW2L873_9BACT
MPHAFHATRWTLVTRATGRDESARTALSELCEIYYEPVLHFIEVRSRDADRARELTHGFFEELLSRENIGSPDPSRGRFRSYLLGAVKHFLAKHHQSQLTQKRGGELEQVPLDEHIPDAADDATRFDRDWAFALIRRAHQALEAEMTASGKGELFQTLKPWLDGGPTASREAACRELGLEANALNVAIHRLRERFRAQVRSEVESTVADPTEVRAEFRYLVDVLAEHR